MQLQGPHHITMITGDAQATVDFYVDVLGLRFVKRTVNFDRPHAYHLYFGDERGTPGSILTWFEFPGAKRGRPGPGMIHRIELSCADAAALDFWAERLRVAGVTVQRVVADGTGDRSDPGSGPERLLFEDHDGLAFALAPAAGGPGDASDPPLRAVHPEIPAEHALTGITGARAYVSREWAGRANQLLTDVLGFEQRGADRYRLSGELRHFEFGYEVSDEPGVRGAGNVHHIAWACADADDQLAFRERVQAGGLAPTEVLDRDYFTSIYFREPRGILFEIATLGPGFVIDEDPEHLGEELRLPSQHEHLRAELERTLTPIRHPRVPA